MRGRSKPRGRQPAPWTVLPIRCGSASLAGMAQRCRRRVLCLNKPLCILAADTTSGNTLEDGCRGALIVSAGSVS
ncbi:hypothetical protein BT67DRAFT_149724 [Trichocladium antarcticum]|uniref:Uncharacterized protein n=1 Tax=Trichocladium antarcticum TaxID=1450529 RepID=A0AAN6ZBI5_9PEZI|nr:hypothetical protein BT67DRAFT_149724 [Trichocladium antarcticum]